MILGHPGLRLLARRKLRGVLRKQWRRLRRPSGIVFAIFGLLLFALWIGSIALGHAFHDGPGVEPGAREPMVRIGALVFCAMTVTGALNHRGLYLPGEEIELLFSAPVSRSDLVRYRMVTNVFRALLGSLVVGLLVMARMPNPGLAFLGCFLAIQTLPVLGQLASLLSGGAENRVLRRFPRGLFLAVNIGGAIVLWVLFMGFLLGNDRVRDRLADVGLEGGIAGLLELPILDALTTPFVPWARMITAPDLASFAPWFVFCAVFAVGLFEVTARLPVDFRELSLQTSADVAKRLNRLRRGGMGASASRASRRAAGWRVPWLLGHGPFGALAWRKLAGIVRKARGTLLVSALIVAFLTVLTSLIRADDEPIAPLAAAMVLVLVGTIYLSAGLRFDFRDDYDHMESIKGWPLSPTRIFLATILPQVLLIVGLLYLALMGRALIVRDFHPLQLLTIPLVPLAVLTWVALDNAVYLAAPVRYLPGQEGALQHMGRTLVMMFLRLAVLAVVLATTGLVFALPRLLGLPSAPAIGVGSVLGLGVLVVEVSALVHVGGVLFRRFDVARQEG